MASNFRNNHPIRTHKKSEANYRRYKPYLAKDFFNRCGYTDCRDFWFGGKNNFHIDHFIPWKTYPDKPNLKTDYSNLVYACSYVNILKSNDEGAYIDPCNVDFNEHFSREADGTIIPNSKSEEATFMYRKLKLHLRRYQIIWMLDAILEKKKLLLEVITRTNEENLKDLYIEMDSLFTYYLEYLGVEQ
jgi:hypothetical protein